MLGILIDAAVLMILLQLVSGQDVELSTAVVMALVASIGTWILAMALVSAMGTAGVFVAAIVAAAGLGAAVSALFGVEIKRSFAIGGIFMFVHLGVGFLVEMMLRA